MALVKVDDYRRVLPTIHPNEESDQYIDEKIKTSGHILHFTIYTSRWLTKDEEKWIIKLWLRFNIQLGVMMIAQHFILQKNCQKVQQFNEVSSQGNLLNTLHYKLF